MAIVRLAALPDDDRPPLPTIRVDVRRGTRALLTLGTASRGERSSATVTELA